MNEVNYCFQSAQTTLTTSYMLTGTRNETAEIRATAKTVRRHNRDTRCIVPLHFVTILCLGDQNYDNYIM